MPVSQLKKPDSTYTAMPTPSFPLSRLPGKIENRSCPDNIVQANQLFQESQEVLIDHNGETYRLRITKNGKLILTK